MSAIELCRTSALGGHVERCDTAIINASRTTLVETEIVRNASRSPGRSGWRRQAELLDTQYFHVVFTVPDEIAVIAFQNKQAV